MGFSLIIWFCWGLFVISSSSEPEVITIDVHKTKALISSGHRYIDVRTEEEFKKGHLDVEDILNIPHMFFTSEGREKNPQFTEQVLSVCKKDDHIILGCQSGVRSLYASVDLLKADVKHVYNMGGGYLSWVENKLPTKIFVDEDEKFSTKKVDDKEL